MVSNSIGNSNSIMVMTMIASISTRHLPRDP